MNELSDFAGLPASAVRQALRRLPDPQQASGGFLPADHGHVARPVRGSTMAGVRSPRMPVGAAVMAAVIGGSGMLHLLRPRLFEPLVPGWLPARRTVVLASGVAELVCAAGLVSRRRWAPVASAALLLAVWPGNWQMAFDVQRDPAARPGFKAAVWARLLLQIPMIRAVLGARRRPGDPVTGTPAEQGRPHSQRSRAPRPA